MLLSTENLHNEVSIVWRHSSLIVFSKPRHQWEQHCYFLAVVFVRAYFNYTICTQSDDLVGWLELCIQLLLSSSSAQYVTNLFCSFLRGPHVSKRKSYVFSRCWCFKDLAMSFDIAGFAVFVFVLQCWTLDSRNYGMWRRNDPQVLHSSTFCFKLSLWQTMSCSSLLSS